MTRADAEYADYANSLQARLEAGEELSEGESEFLDLAIIAGAVRPSKD